MRHTFGYRRAHLLNESSLVSEVLRTLLVLRDDALEELVNRPVVGTASDGNGKIYQRIVSCYFRLSARANDW